MESNLKCFFLKGKYRASDDFLVLILLIFGGLRYFLLSLQKDAKVGCILA